MSNKHPESSPHREADERDGILHEEVNEDTDSLAAEDNDSLQNQNNITDDADLVEYGHVNFGELVLPLPEINNTDNRNAQEVEEDLSNSKAVINDRVDCDSPLTSSRENERTKFNTQEEVNKCAVTEQTTMIAEETRSFTPDDKNIVEDKELGNIAVRKSPEGLGVAAEDDGRLRSITTTNTNATPRVISPVPDRVRRHPMDSKTTSDDDSSEECKHQLLIHSDIIVMIA